MEDLKRIVNDFSKGRRIFENIPEMVRPCWGGLILKQFTTEVSSVPVVEELIQLIAEKEKWNQAYEQFSEIRRFRLEHPQYRPEIYLPLAEKVAKITYNATNPSGPFDHNSGWFIPGLALQTCFALHNKCSPQFTEITASWIMMFEYLPELREHVQSPDDFQVFLRIDDLLMFSDWEPVIVNYVTATHEYRNYALKILQLCKSGTSVNMLAEYLYDTVPTEKKHKKDMRRYRAIAEEILQKTEYA